MFSGLHGFTLCSLFSLLNNEKVTLTESTSPPWNYKSYKMKYNSNCILIQQFVKAERINTLRTSFIGVSCIYLRTLIRVLVKLD